MTRSVFITPRAKREIDRIDTWWVSHRADSRNLFFEELQGALAAIRAAPTIGSRYAGRTRGVRRVLLRATRYHVYFSVNQHFVVVLSVWSAVRGRGPAIRGA